MQNNDVHGVLIEYYHVVLMQASGARAALMQHVRAMLASFCKENIEAKAHELGQRKAHEPGLRREKLSFGMSRPCIDSSNQGSLPCGYRFDLSVNPLRHWFG
jgi:hypothetical protein